MKKLRYFDFLRAAACCLIVYYHIGTGLAEQLSDRMPALPLYIGKNLHVASFAVTVFFMLSGAGLSLSVLAKPLTDLRAFYARRFRRLLVPFYITYACVFLLRLAWHLTDHSPLFPEKVPLWHFVFTLTGLDGYLSWHGVSTFYLGIGEWFIGCLILLYLLFPLLHRFMSRHPALFGLCAAALFAVSCMLFSSVNAFCFRLAEFAFGMLIGTYCTRVPRKALIPAVPVFLLILLWPAELPGHWALKNLFAVLAVWAAASACEPPETSRRLPFVTAVSSISYEIFLVHHVVISWFTRLWTNYLPLAGILPLILAETAVILLLAAALHRITRKV